MHALERGDHCALDLFRRDLPRPGTTLHVTHNIAYALFPKALLRSFDLIERE